MSSPTKVVELTRSNGVPSFNQRPHQWRQQESPQLPGPGTSGWGQCHERRNQVHALHESIASWMDAGYDLENTIAIVGSDEANKIVPLDKSFGVGIYDPTED